MGSAGRANLGGQPDLATTCAFFCPSHTGAVAHAVCDACRYMTTVDVVSKEVQNQNQTYCEIRLGVSLIEQTQNDNYNWDNTWYYRLLSTVLCPPVAVGWLVATFPRPRPPGRLALALA